MSRLFYDDGQIQIWHGRCEDVLPLLAPVDVVITDPPYGFHKAGWDDVFPTAWLEQAGHVAKQAIAVMPGINNLLSMPREIGPFTYRWMLSVHLTNGMTRGLMGFGNWIPVLVYGRPDVSLYAPQQDATAVPVAGLMPDHPSPKPLGAMRWIVSRFPTAESVLDPFMGSGTTLRAAKDLGKRAIGIEVNEAYCQLAVERLRQSAMQFVEAT